MTYFFPVNEKGRPFGKTIFTDEATAGAVAGYLFHFMGALFRIEACDGVPEWSDNTETREIWRREPGPGYMKPGDWHRIICRVRGIQ